VLTCRYPAKEALIVTLARYHQQALQTLRDLVRIDTTNPPGNETAAAAYLAQKLGAAGIQAEVIESQPGRGNLVARLRGAGEAKPLLLMGHLDVVAADPTDWEEDPFAAVVRDGFLWGRGSTDNKQMIATAATILLALKEGAVPLKRDVLFIGAADEEHGGRQGMGYLARERRDLFDVAGAINEGGGGAIETGGRLFYTCQTGEKGVCRTVWTSRAPGGHGSAPRRDLSTAKLVRALARLGDGYVRPNLTETMRRALTLIAQGQSSRLAARVVRLLDQGKLDEALLAAGLAPEQPGRTRSLLFDSASITGLSAGDPASINVIPGQARAYVDGRILPGQTREGYLQVLRNLAQEDVDIEVYAEQYSPGLESTSDTDLYHTIERVVAQRCDGAQVVPWLCAGSTDAKHLVPLGVPVYGFIPTPPLPPGVTAPGAHAANERLWLDHLPFMFDTLFDVTLQFCRDGNLR